MFLGIAVQAFTVPIIQATGCAAEIVGPAADYMRIRAYSMPATLVLMMAQVWRFALLPYRCNEMWLSICYALWAVMTAASFQLLLLHRDLQV